MLKTIKALIGVTQKGDASTAELEAALDGARTEIEAAERDRAAAEKAYQDGLLSLDEAALAKLVLPRQGGFVPDSLASGIRLPGLRPGEPDMWLSVGGSSWFGPPGASADEVLAFAKSLDEQPKGKFADPRLAPMQDWTLDLLDEPKSAETAPARDAA